MIIRVRDESGNFIKLPLGTVSDKQLAAAIGAYLSEHKPAYTADEVGAYSKPDADRKFVPKSQYIDDMAHLARVDMLNNLFELKADKSTTLSGYGITDAYSKTEVDETEQRIVNYVDEEILTLDKKIDSLPGSSTETILYEDVVNTPEWTNQPTFEGELDSAFNTNDFYYVTLKDADGNALPDGQFMLKETKEENATVYSTVFSLANLATGTDTLVENFPIEFTEVGTTVKMRDAGVWRVNYSITDWALNGITGSVKIAVIGEFVQRVGGAQFSPVFTVSKYVSSYHSAHATSSQSNSTKQIIPYAVLSVVNYKENHFYDESILKRNGDNTFTFKRAGFLRCINQGGTTYTVTNIDTVGYGAILEPLTNLSSVSIQSLGNKSNGFIRNGTIIRISEVV